MLWAVSADSQEEAAALAKRLHLTYPLVSDPELRLIRAFGVEMQGREIAIPSTFVLAPQGGRIVWRYIGETMFDRSDLRAILQAVERAVERAQEQAGARSPSK